MQLNLYTMPSEYAVSRATNKISTRPQTRVAVHTHTHDSLSNFFTLIKTPFRQSGMAFLFLLIAGFAQAQIAVGKKEVTLSYDSQTSLIAWNGEITTSLDKAALYQKLKTFTGSRYHPESSEKVTDDAVNGIIEIRCQFDEVHKILGSMTVAPTGAVYFTVRLQVSGSAVKYSFTNFYHRVDARHLRTVLPSFGYLEDFDTPEERETLSKYYQQNYKDDLAAIISQAEAHVTIEIAKLNQFLTK